MNEQHASERIILGGIINGGQRALVNASQGGLRTMDFQDWRHRIIFLAAKDLARRPDDDIDLITISCELDQSGLVEAAGGPAYLHGLLADYLKED